MTKGSKRPRTVLITGTSKGIGAAIRNRFLADGHFVIGISRKTDSQYKHTNFRHYGLDLSRLDTIQNAVRAIVKNHPEIDTLVSNAGAPCFGSLESFSDLQIQEALNLNLTSHIFMARHCLPTLKNHPHSDIVIMGSESSVQGGPKGTLYCAAKFGLRGFAQALRRDNARSGVRVSCLLPGMVRTPFFDELDFRPGPNDNHAIEADDVAEAVATIIGARPGTTFDEITLSPQVHRIEFDKN